MRCFLHINVFLLCYFNLNETISNIPFQFVTQFQETVNSRSSQPTPRETFSQKFVKLVLYYLGPLYCITADLKQHYK